jgi:hypothetical protein
VASAGTQISQQIKGLTAEGNIIKGQLLHGKNTFLLTRYLQLQQIRRKVHGYRVLLNFYLALMQEHKKRALSMQMHFV